MKIKWNSTYTTIAVYVFLTVAACICFNAFVQWFPLIWEWIKKLFSILSPFIYGFIIAYLINPTEKALAKRVEKLLVRLTKAKKEKKGKKIPKNIEVNKKTVRAISIVTTYIIFLLIIAVFVWILVPQVTNSLVDIRDNFKSYVDSALNLINSIGSALQDYTSIDILSNIIGGTYEDVKDILDKLMEIFNKYSPKLITMLDGFVQELKNIFIGILVSIYMLAGRDKFKAQFRKIASAFLPDAVVSKTFSVVADADKCFGGFIIGKIIDSLIIGVLCFLIMVVFGFPYPMLISLVVGVTNIIPFFGPFIGGIPSAILVFLTKPQMTLWFVLAIIVIQQLDGNFIGPKIIGNTTGLSSFWVLFSIIVMGGLYGITGMIIAVPLFSLLYSESKHIVELLLEKKGKKKDTNSYM